MPDPHVITLRKPVGPKGHEITELRLREPRAGEVMRAGKETGDGMALSLLMQVTGLDIAVIQALPTRASNTAMRHLMAYVAPILADPTESRDEPVELPDELTIDLADTIQIGTTWISRLDLHEPTLGEKIKVEKYDGMQKVLNAVALASGQPRAVIEMVPISEYAKAAAYVMPFLFGAPETTDDSLGA